MSIIPVVVLAQQTNNQSGSSENNPEEMEDSIVHLEKMFITATRTEIPLKEVASSVTVISAEEIDKKRGRTVLEVLRGTLGLDVSEAGGIGKQSSVFIRGANSEHTLVLIDGIEMNDPISTGRGYNFANLTIENIERIEIVRGPQSTLYGSDAIGGVINIITKRGTGKPSFFASAEGGSFKTFREVVGVQGSWKWIDYSLGLSRLATDGFSAANEKNQNSEKDGFKNTSFSTKLALTPIDNLRIDFVSKYIGSETEIDNFGGQGGDDINNRVDYRAIGFNIQANLWLLNHIWRQKLGFSLMNHNSAYRNDTDIDHPSDLSHSSYDSQMRKLEWQHNLYFHKVNTVTIGIEAEEEKGKSDYYSESSWGPYSSVFEEKACRAAGGYIQDHIRLWDCFFTTLGARLDYHEKFGTYGTYRIASAYLFKNMGTKVKGTLGTGFKAPSLFQLYSNFGDENLEPEKSIGWDIGAEQLLWGDRFSVTVTYFSNDFTNLIKYDGQTKKYQNISGAASKGIELAGNIQPLTNLDIQACYTHTRAEDKQTNEELLQRPQHKVKGNISYRFFDKVNFNLEGIHVSKKLDYPNVEMEDYNVLNLAAMYDITDNISLLGRIDNVLNAEYEEVKGYGTAGISGYTGFKVKF